MEKKYPVYVETGARKILIGHVSVEISADYGLGPKYTNTIKLKKLNIDIEKDDIIYSRL